MRYPRRSGMNSSPSTAQSSVPRQARSRGVNCSPASRRRLTASRDSFEGRGPWSKRRWAARVKTGRPPCRYLPVVLSNRRLQVQLLALLVDIGRGEVQLTLFGDELRVVRLLLAHVIAPIRKDVVEDGSDFLIGEGLPAGH